MANNLKIFSLFRVKTHEMLRDTIDFLVETFNQSRKVFTAASPFGQVLFVIENISNFVFYFIEDAITELNIKQATRASSVYGLADLAGYRPSRSISATGMVEINRKSAPPDINVQGGIVIVPNYLTVTCVNNSLSYVMVFQQDELRLTLTDTSIIPVYIQQGTIETQSFTGTGNQLSSFSVQYPRNYYIDNFNVSVYVNDVKWKRYNNLLQIPRGSNGYMIKTGLNSGIDLYFGNGMFGNIPELGSTIRVEYLTNDGFGGSVLANDPSQVQFKFKDTGFNLLGEEIDLNEMLYLTTKVVPYFGANPEPIELTRMMLSKADVGLICLENYELVLRRLQAFSIIRVSRDPVDERMVDLFLILDIKKNMTSGETYFTIPESRFTLTHDQANSILVYIEMSGTKLIATDVKILSPRLSKYVINVSMIVFEDVATDVIQQNIIDAISDYFLSTQRNDRLPNSDIVAVIEAINGVDSVSVRMISEKNELKKKRNSNAKNTGVDDYNDIIMNQNELPIVRGGWTDRNGNAYAEGLTNVGYGAVNIVIRDIVQRPKTQ